MRIAKFIFLSATILSSNIIHAQTGGDIIIVTASRDETPVSKVGQSVSVITAKDIETRQSAAVADLLRDVPGVTVTRNGGIGTNASVSIRGADSDQTVALIDGVKINDPSSPGGGFNFGNLLTGNIGRIEIVRGSQSVLWGSQAIGGVVNIITQHPAEALSVNANAEYGWRNSANLVGNVSGKFGPVSASIGGGYFRTNGFSAFNEGRGGTERDGYRNIGANAKFNIALSQSVSLNLRGWYSGSKVGIDGFAPPDSVFGDTIEQALTKELIGYAGLNVSLLDGRFRNRFAYAYTYTGRENLDLSGAFAFQTFDATGKNKRFEYQGNFDIAKGWLATFGAEREESSYISSSFGGPALGADVRIDGIYAQIAGTPIDGLTINAGLRHDDHQTFGGETIFSGNIVYAPSTKNTILRASYGEGFKAPSLFQLLSDFGNPDLQPERSKSYDAGITQRLLDGRIEVGATYFYRTATDQIVFGDCPGTPTFCATRPFGTYDNVARTRANGLELSLILKPTDAFTVQANYSWINAKNRANGLKLQGRPGQSVNVSADYTWAFGLATGATVRHIGRSFDDAANVQRLEGYILADIRASFPVTHQWEVYGRIENLFDEEYETIFGYGTPRRGAYAGIRLGF
jgi:vitamin B12 transporter